MRTELPHPHLSKLAAWLFVLIAPALVSTALAAAALAQEQPRPPATSAAGDGEPAEPAEAAKKKPPRPGIPVTDPVVHTHCVRCHALDEELHMTRISYLRKSPEGWAETTKRMLRLHGLQMSPADAKEVVRSLANTHGLARSEAERGLYESERRVHWSEDQHEQDFKRACAQCHPLGRVLLQQRDQEEWQLLRATHVAMFPLAQRQIGGGAPRDTGSRGEMPPEVAAAIAARSGGAGSSGARGGAGGASGGSDASSGPASAGRGRSGGGSVGDRVLDQLAKDQPLFSEAWKSWSRNKRTVPLAGTWTVVGHEVGRGDLFGTAVITSTGEDEYDVQWQLAATDGSTIRRAGKGLLYAGYSWRGRSTEDETTWREVLLLDESWQQLKGRMFTGNHDEVGADVTLHRESGRARVLGLGNRAVTVPATGHVLDVYGESFPAAPAAVEFFAGEGVTVTGVERVTARHVRLIVDVAAGTELGSRVVAYGSNPGVARLQLYDTVDYVRVTPLQGLARVGGARHPTQIERFEAIACNRGPDRKPYTDDDIDLFQVRPRWALEEFRVREQDDDVRYVGNIDAATGVFTPAVDGPNPERKWSANNIGDVYVTAEVELEVPVRPPEPAADKDTDKNSDKDSDKNSDKDRAVTGNGDSPTAAPPPRERRTFRARSHLIVTVPLYVRWAFLDWEDR